MRSFGAFCLTHMIVQNSWICFRVIAVSLARLVALISGQITAFIVSAIDRSSKAAFVGYVRYTESLEQDDERVTS